MDFDRAYFPPIILNYDHHVTMSFIRKINDLFTLGDSTRGIPTCFDAPSHTILIFLWNFVDPSD